MPWLFWLVITDIRYAIHCVNSSYDGSKLIPLDFESISTTADLALASYTSPPDVSVSAFLAGITN